MALDTEIDSERDAEWASASESRRRVSDLEQHKLALRRDFESASEVRPVECAEAYDVKRGVVTVTRADTGEVLERRAITLAERQMLLPCVPAGPTGATSA